MGGDSDTIENSKNIYNINMTILNAFLDQLMSWQAVLDIGLISAGLFFLYRTLTKLGTWKIFLGICSAFLFFVIASVLNLEGVEWIFRNISHVALLALIVIFQPELRKIFEKIVLIYGHKKKIRVNSDIETLATSLWKMAQDHCGALVVIPGQESINDKISGGYALNADVSMPLVLSIFDHHSPGHDGALIFENNKLVRFGVRLPISESGRLGNDYGTRHHAAMGLAEQSDALALVVSEERGKVSLCSNGRMRGLESIKEIVAAINTHYRRYGFAEKQKGGFLNRAVVAQIAVCVAIASIFWSSLVVVNQQIVERVITVPVEYASPKPGFVLAGEKIDEVKIHLTGTKSDLDNLSVAKTSVNVNLSEINEGAQSVLITKNNLRLPRNITLLDAVPASLEVTLVGIVQKTVPVVPQLIGKLPEGKQLKIVKVEPETVQILAPPDQNGNKTVNVSTTPIYLNSIDSSTSLYCKIIAPPSMQPVDKKWPDIVITFEIEE
ncbi:diadenylate cyclase [Desulfogranum marinum]|uniref:diadenylate cyclase n=1 Tax=Desulfogranum marinum TaxID=453220 RepID=UPI002FC94539